MIERLTDEQILQGLRQYDETITSEFFYDTCRMAYSIDNKKYGLRYKAGMDFYTLAHDYYLRLCTHGWQQLERRKPNISLANWTINGFHYIVRERLKSYANGAKEDSLDERAAKGNVVFDTPDDTTQQEVRDMVEEICHSFYRDDRRAQSILRMILILGMKVKEVAEMLGITPSAVSQRFRSMMDDVVRPFFMSYYESMPQVAYHESSPTMAFTRDGESLVLPKKKTSKPLKKLGISIPMLSNKRREADEWLSRVTPDKITTLGENQIFVFGSDLRGIHCGGTAYQALRDFGAQLGMGVGPQGHCYAIPTIVGGLDNIRPYVDEFVAYASAHPRQVFLVTRVGCGIAGFSEAEIAPLFAIAASFENIHLPKEFWQCLI